MSVRPITLSEEERAFGSPYSEAFTILGFTQGVLYYLHVTKSPFKSNWFANPRNIPLFAALVVGGSFGGQALGMLLFGDKELRRLHLIHSREQKLLLAGQISPNQQ
eukprot:403370731